MSEPNEMGFKFKQMTEAQKKAFLLDLWKACFLKAKGSFYILKILMDIRNNIQNFGTFTHIDLEQRRPVYVYFGNKHSLILLRDSKIRQYWNLLMSILLLYLAIWVPYFICLIPITEP